MTKSKYQQTIITRLSYQLPHIIDNTSRISLSYFLHCLTLYTSTRDVQLQQFPLECINDYVLRHDCSYGGERFVC